MKKYGNPRPADLGGLFKNDQGVCIALLSGKADSAEAKLCTIYFGLQYASDDDFPDLWVEPYRKVAVNLILEGDPHFYLLRPLVMVCRILRARPWNCRLSYILHEGNSCADYLANRGHGNNDPTLLDSPLQVWVFSSLRI